MIKKKRRLSISHLIALGFASVILSGTLLLMLPIASQSGTITPFMDALFTASSAVCVTGQVTLNTASHWTYFGKTVIIILIEIGGLGFMSVIVLLSLFFGKKLSLVQRKTVADAINSDSVSDAQKLIRYIIKFSITIQMLGALILSIDFIPRFGFLKGIYFSIFHAISAFCNAGFDLFGNSLEGFQTNPLVLLTIGGLIFFGGLGFIVWRDILSYRHDRRLLLHTRITLITTGSILLFSFLLFWISESRAGTFAHLGFFDHLTNTLFMAITPRTAGYANVNYAMVSPMGILLTLILMFIGASSGSTGGGVKVTTVATAFIYLKSKFLGQDTHFGNRSIPKEKIVRSFMILFSGILLIIGASMILMITETIPKGFGMEYILMEVFSCFGTVGLTMGLTPHLTAIGKAVLIIVMFAGRIGLLTFFVSLSGRKNDKEDTIKYPEGSILIG